MKPTETFQTFNGQENLLTVHVSNDPESEIYYQGPPEDYDGTATEPPAPTQAYIEKHPVS